MTGRLGRRKALIRPVAPGRMPHARCVAKRHAHGNALRQSKRAYNGALYYDDNKFSARGSVGYRGPYIDGSSATGNVDLVWIRKRPGGALLARVRHRSDLVRAETERCGQGQAGAEALLP